MSHSVGRSVGLVGRMRNRHRPRAVREGVPGLVSVPGEGRHRWAPSFLLGSRGISLVHVWKCLPPSTWGPRAELWEAGLGAACRPGEGRALSQLSCGPTSGSCGDRPTHYTTCFPGDGWMDYVRHLQRWRD